MLTEMQTLYNITSEEVCKQHQNRPINRDIIFVQTGYTVHMVILRICCYYSSQGI